ncbi:DNA-directed RNA polymerase subunit beta [Lysinibacillus agricola]|uniref:DNA-directed RNA polymerase subunit beta n=1 Tax=Lysinibacillus agricola TaxID=2590012 RepID=A0ABX7AT92_9BACI|nr:MULTISPECIES: DNA-directed RNA polymerase subunit beta [Lysinibacillus]KOS60786.1 DNA-directed RNA polymerase subunit beta [Lysinibacillus sp. FJAT-14222]QQP13186.1 DNA-directed RNA polymerase subunit beta [Lysinibacillus agricola]
MTNDSSRRSVQTKETDTPPEEKEQGSNGVQREVRWVQIRLIPIWLRVVLIIVLVVVAAILGAMFGYSVIGQGKAMDVFKPETWRHIFDIMNGKE